MFIKYLIYLRELMNTKINNTSKAKTFNLIMLTQ